MSPWLTIMAHSVLLFSPEPLNGSLAFNKTCIARSKVHLNPSLSGLFSVWLLMIMLVCFSFEIQSAGGVCDSDH